MAAAKLASGARLGPYEIVALLGAGGMGEVYFKVLDTYVAWPETPALVGLVWWFGNKQGAW